MKNALILHGTSGNSQANWFPWLKQQLEDKGYKVWVPDLPQADEPNLEHYKQLIFPNWQFDEDSILIGHSSGATAILGLLQELPVKNSVRKAILVAGFEENLGPGWEMLNGLFLRPFDFELIKKRCKEFVIIQSDNDPHVSMPHALALEKLLNGKLVVMKQQGHFSIDSMGERYKKFPELLELI